MSAQRSLRINYERHCFCSRWEPKLEVSSNRFELIGPPEPQQDHRAKSSVAEALFVSRRPPGFASLTTCSDLFDCGHRRGSLLMTASDTVHTWWSRLRHQGLLLSPVVLIERHPNEPESAAFHFKNRLRMRRLVSPSLSLRIKSEIIPLSWHFSCPISRNPSAKANPISEGGVPTAQHQKPL
jgi:hypothetical protein